MRDVPTVAHDVALSEWRDRAAGQEGIPMGTIVRSRRLRSLLISAVILFPLCLTPGNEAVLAGRPVGETESCRLPSGTGWLDEGVPTDFEVFLEPHGELRALMLFVDFPDAPIAAAAPEWRDFDSYLALHGPGADWLRTASYGSVRLEITPVETWYRMSEPSAAYGLDRAATFEEHVAYLREAVGLADADVDFSAWDIVYVVTGPNAVGISNSPGYIDASDSHITADGRPISHGATFGTDVWSWPEPARHLVLAHETGHLFGLPDLYAFGGDTHQFVGGWDVMADIDGHAPGFFSWHRWKLGWTDDRQVVCLPDRGTYNIRLTAVDRQSGTKLAVIPTGATSAYAIESRRPTGLDATACSSGVLLYRIDSSVASGFGPIQVIDASPGDVVDGLCTDLDVATLGLGSLPTTFTDPVTGITVAVERQSRWHDWITVTIG